MGSERTNGFKEALQKEFQAILGEKCKLSKDEAWRIFKASISTAVETVSNDPEMRLPLSGVGTFSISMHVPRVPAGVISPLVIAAGEKGLPYFKFKVSDSIRNMLIKKHTGIDPATVGNGEAGKDEKSEAPAETADASAEL